MARMSKRLFWLKHYLDKSNPVTFLNGTQSAKAAGYDCQDDASFAAAGSRNFTALISKIDKWLDEEGLSTTTLRIKLATLLDAKETKFFSCEGHISDEVEVEALETQRKSLDMALKVKGMYAAEKKEYSGPNGGPIKTEGSMITADMTETQAAELYARMIKNDG